MVAEATVRPGLPAERVFYLSMVGALWAGVVLGFSRSFILRPLFPNAHGAPEPYFYAHGFLFLGWLALLATQAGLVSAGNLRLHRRLGVAGVVMVPLMTVVCPGTGVAKPVAGANVSTSTVALVAWTATLPLRSVALASQR